MITLAILKLYKKAYMKKHPEVTSDKELNFLAKKLITKLEALEWDGFPRQCMIYMLQSVLFSLLQLKHGSIRSWIEALS